MSLIARGFAATVNHLLGQAPWARERLVVFRGSQLRLRAQPIELHLAIDAHGELVESTQAEPEPDVTISLPLGELPLALPGGIGALMNAVHIEGNAELADVLGFVFRNLRWDAEEDLAQLIGDIPAHRIAAGVQSLKGAHERALEALAGNLSEYVVEERQLLVTPGAVLAFGDEVRALRDDVARLEKRIERLQRSARTR